jgi:hypothetical protein
MFEPYDVVSWLYIRDTKGIIHLGLTKGPKSRVLSTCKRISNEVQRVTYTDIADLDEASFCKDCFDAL